MSGSFYYICILRYLSHTVSYYITLYFNIKGDIKRDWNGSWHIEDQSLHRSPEVNFGCTSVIEKGWKPFRTRVSFSNSLQKLILPFPFSKVPPYSLPLQRNLTFLCRPDKGGPYFWVRDEDPGTFEDPINTPPGSLRPRESRPRNSHTLTPFYLWVCNRRGFEVIHRLTFKFGSRVRFQLRARLESRKIYIIHFYQ